MKEYISKRIKGVLPQSLFFIITFCFYMPIALYLSNIDEFSIRLRSIICITLLVGVITGVFIIILAVICYHKIVFNVFSMSIYSLALGFYLQGNFLNPKLHTLNGSKINWNEFKTQGIISIVVWLLCIIIPQIIIIVKKDIMKKITLWSSLAFCAMQIFSLSVMVFTTPRTVDVDYALTKDNEFELSTQENTVVFVIDTLDAQWFEKMILNQPEYKDSFTDFTYFDDAVAGGAPTILGVPTLLTGKIYSDTTMTPEQYYDEAYAGSDLFKDLQENGCKVNIYADYIYLNSIAAENIDNVTNNPEYVIEDKGKFINYLYKFTSFYAMPQFLKQHFYFYTDSLSKLVKLKDLDGKELFKVDDCELYKDFCNSGITTQNEMKTFAYYHLNGAHSPYTLDENLNYCNEGTDVVQQVRGSFKFILDMINQMKSKGVYDNSTIIITADHGGVDLYQNPFLLVKEKNTREAFSINSNPVTFTNVNATFASSLLSDHSKYGKNVFEVTPEDNKERYHCSGDTLGIPLFPDKPFVKEQEWTLYKITGNSRDMNNVIPIPNKNHENEK